MHIPPSGLSSRKMVKMKLSVCIPGGSVLARPVQTSAKAAFELRAPAAVFIDGSVKPDVGRYREISSSRKSLRASSVAQCWCENAFARLGEHVHHRAIRFFEGNIIFEKASLNRGMARVATIDTGGAMAALIGASIVIIELMGMKSPSSAK